MRSEKGMKQIYDLGQDGQDMNTVASVPQNCITPTGKVARTKDCYLDLSR